jgi:hypothetical protein
LSLPDSPNRLNSAPGARASHQRIHVAAQKAADHVPEITKSPNPVHRVQRLKQWISFLRDAVRIVLVTVPDPSKAFTIFETLNDRGLKLSQVDLLKNHLYGLASGAKRLDEAQARWSEMYGALEASGHERLALDYIRQLWISYNGHTREDELFDKIKEFAKSPGKAIELAGMLSANAIPFTSLLNPSHPLWSDQTNATRRCVQVLVDNLRVDRIRPLLLSILAKFNKKETERSFRLCVTWTVRFLIVGGIGSGTIEKFYAETAKKVRDGAIADAEALNAEMRKHVPADDKLKDRFAVATVSRSYLARYYLHALDRYSKDKGTPSAKEAALAIDDEPERHDWEHVIPQRVSETYAMDDEQRTGLVNRLGNQAIIEKPLNSQMKSNEFSLKRPHYSKSAFIHTKKLFDLATFGQAEIDVRQRELADLALKVWPLRVV